MSNTGVTELKPQPGPQEQFLSTQADICIYGGSAGGGKTVAILMEPLRHMENGLFRGVIFRRVTPQIRNPGGLLDESINIYSRFDGDLKDSTLEWTFPSGSKIKLAQMEHEKNKEDWQGSQIPYIGFDEVTHFTESMFVYMMSRNRSSSGIPGYIRATCNPDCESWVRKWIDWWIGEDGYPIASRSGVIRYFVRINGEMVWADTREELEDIYGQESMPKSFTFIASSIYDNKILMDNDPSYLGSLKALPRVEQLRLLGGNWDVKPEAGMFFQRAWCEIVDAAPVGVKTVRYWDRACTLPSEVNKDPDYTAGVKIGKGRDGFFYVMDVKRFRGTSMTVENIIKNMASQDGKATKIRLEEEPGASGKAEAAYMVRQLSGYQAKACKSSKDKLTRFLPFSAQAEAGNIKIVRGPWNDAYFNELENFCGDGKGHDDQADGSSGAFNELCEHPSIASNEITLGFSQKNKFEIS